MDSKQRITVEATVAGHEMFNGNLVTKLDIPSFQSKYPIGLYGLSDEQREELDIGKTYVIVLERGNIKKNRDGSPKSGSQHFDFHWNYVGYGNPSDVRTAQPASRPAATGQPAAARTDATGASIERQVAAKCAAEIMTRMVVDGADIADVIGDYEKLFDAIAARIANGTPVAAETPQEPVAEAQE